ncbi:hypothetical protein P43SY_006864 [Pythium insidiosum]|uniref:Uncharacterized protein n=1 Tax=Pythium insidiosum TaxID=114742 RepID=A0AAD5MA19_PYTIN|nr:hypothetical protein P43SY_006864 [Pythium insidiosum]
MGTVDKPVDSTQVVLDKKPAARASPSASSFWSSPTVSLGLKVAAVLFVVGNVIALYVLHFENRPAPSTRFSFSNVATSATGATPKSGEILSLSTLGAARTGAGTTAYLNTATVADPSGAEYCEYINLAPMSVSLAASPVNLISYRRVRGATKESVLTTVSFSPKTKAATVAVDAVTAASVMDAGHTIRGLATVSDSSAVVLTLSDAAPYTVQVLPAAWTAPTNVALEKTKAVTVTTLSMSNVIAPIGPNAFVVAYYESYMTSPYAQRVKVGTLDPTTRAITFSTNAPVFGPANDNDAWTNFGRPQALASSSSASSSAPLAFVIPFYAATSNATLNGARDSGLCLTMASFDRQANAVSAFTSAVCDKRFQPTYLLESLRITPVLLAVVFYDSKNNGALTVVLARVPSAETVATSAPQFRSVYVFAEAVGPFSFGAGWGFWPKPSLALLAGNRLAVSFMNQAASGLPSVKILQFSTASLALKDVTPVLPTTQDAFTLEIEQGGLDGTITHDVIAVGDDSVLTGHLGKRGAATHATVSVVEAFGAPVGVVHKCDGKTKATATISGHAEDVMLAPAQSKLQSGQTYYATTAGYVVSADAAASPAGAEFIVASENKRVLVTVDSKVGYAIDDDTIFVTTA